MRLHSLSVRNFRVLRDVQVELAPGLNLIGAPNETGKSTLIEAAHRALFLKARVTGKWREAMLSQQRADHPEVVVSFVAHGRTWQVMKKFAGPSGQCTLTEEGGATWRGDEAEARLAEVLGVATAAGRAVTDQWAHLWVRQGESGTDPTERANEQKGALLSRLEQVDPTVVAVMQSALDSTLAAGFQERHEALFQRNGEPRAQSPLGRAEEEWNRAREAVAAAQERCAALERSAAAFSLAGEALDRAEADAALVAPQAAAVETALARVAELRAVEARQALEVEAARLYLERLLEAERQIDSFAENTRALAEALAPEERAAETLALEEDQCLGRLEAAESERVSAVAARAAAQQAHDLAVTKMTVVEKTAEWHHWQERRQVVEVLQAENRRLALELAALPVIDAGALKTLTAMEKSRDEAAATLRGMAAGVHVLAADQPVQLDGADLVAGEERVLTTTAELVIGRGVRLRLTPGGGAGLEAASRCLAEADESLRTALASFGVPSVTAAAEVLDRRRQHEGERSLLRKRLSDLEADALPARAAAAADALAAAEVALARQESSSSGEEGAMTPPDDLAAAQARCRQTAAGLSAAQSREVATATARASLDKALALVRKRRTDHAAALAGRRAELERARARHEYLVSTHGETTARRAALATAKEAWTLAGAALEATRAELIALNPESLEADRERLRRAIEDIGRRRQQAETARAIARSELTRDGGDDPHERLAQALAWERSAEETAAHERREAEAIRLLHRLFAEEQRELAARLIRPLAERINAYLECVFGQGAQAVLAFEDQAFGAFALARPGHLAGAVPFAALSGGAREQVAAAMRLAMAEVLAAGHDGCLPLVFDDAFAHSDPARLQSLLRMLDLAARRGLQVIVLTCTPADYAGLGARMVALGAS